MSDASPRHETRRRAPWAATTHALHALAALTCLLALTPLSAAADDPDDALALTLIGSVSAGQIGADTFVTLYVAGLLEVDDFSVALQAPIRLRVADAPPTNEGALRHRDWDEVSDYFRVIQFAQWAEPGALLYGRLGELSGASLGHETLVGRYLNVVDIDHFQLGLDAEVNTLYGGLELLLDNLADPEVIAARAYARPWGASETLARDLTFGLTFVTDVDAPLTPRLDAVGRPRVDPENNLIFDTRAVFALGVDVALIAYEDDVISVTPYVDGAALWTQASGLGLHAGVLTELSASIFDSLALRVEYQLLGPGYLPRYVDTLYEIQRQIYPSPTAYGRGEATLTRQRFAALRQEVAHGWLVQLAADVMGWFEVGALYHDAEGPNNSHTLLQVLIPAFDRLQLGIVHARSGFEGAEFFDLDGTLIQAFVEARVWWLLHVQAYYNRAWRLEDDPASPDLGRYRTVDDWGVGVGIRYTL